MNEPDTRSAILDHARSLFAQHGYRGTSIRAITAHAGANLGAVTYHFGTKAALYDAVLESVAEPLVAALRNADHAATTPLAAIEAIVRGFAEFLGTHPEIPPLLAHELAFNHPTPGPQRRAMQQIMALVSARIRAGQEAGSIAAGDSLLLTFSIVAQPIYLNLVRRRLQDVFGVDTDAPEAHAAVVDHLVRFVRRGLMPSERNS